MLNKEGYKQEIKWAMNKMLEVYGVKEFCPMKSGNAILRQRICRQNVIYTLKEI